ncbi:MAG TPA: YbjN domain-containing protein [Parvularculaceae bacterium]|nr:YbjN domain-containing protein [Parvularculaceae bacterium]
MIGRGMKRAAAAGAAALALGLFAGASAQMKSAITADELEAVLSDAGLSPSMTTDASTGAPVAKGKAGDVTFWVRALDCSGTPKSCQTLMFFANFDLGRGATANDFRIMNKFNDKQVFGRAYVLDASQQVGVDYVIELTGGVSMDNLTSNIARWSDVITAFMNNFTESQTGSS